MLLDQNPNMVVVMKYIWVKERIQPCITLLRDTVLTV